MEAPMLSQTCEYALRAVACLAHHPGEFVTASDLANATNVPSDYLSKVLQQLAGAKVVQGRRGVGGGYRLAREPEQITLLEIIEAMGVFQRLRSCPTHQDEARGLCPLHKTVDQAVEAAESVFRNKTLADMLSESDVGGRLCVERLGNGSVSSTASNGTAKSPSTLKPMNGTMSNGVKTNGDLTAQRFARTSATKRTVDEDFDDSRIRAAAAVATRPQFTADGKLKARPRRIVD
jgi:Rrf2 family protein